MNTLFILIWGLMLVSSSSIEAMEEIASKEAAMKEMKCRKSAAIHQQIDVSSLLSMKAKPVSKLGSTEMIGFQIVEIPIQDSLKNVFKPGDIIVENNGESVTKPALNIARSPTVSVCLKVIRRNKPLYFLLVQKPKAD